MQVKIWINLFCNCTLMVRELYQYVRKKGITVKILINLLCCVNSINIFGEKGIRLKTLVNLFRNCTLMVCELNQYVWGERDNLG